MRRAWIQATSAASMASLHSACTRGIKWALWRQVAKVRDKPRPQVKMVRSTSLGSRHQCHIQCVLTHAQVTATSEAPQAGRECASLPARRLFVLHIPAGWKLPCFPRSSLLGLLGHQRSADHRAVYASSMRQPPDPMPEPMNK
eukprot:scaffold14874_cov133-Isochrysis_galbana.AAC.2